MKRMYGKRSAMELSVAFDLTSLSDFSDNEPRRSRLSRFGKSLNFQQLLLIKFHCKIKKIILINNLS